MGEKHPYKKKSTGSSYTWPKQVLNPQLMCPDLKSNTCNLWCTGWCATQLSHPAGALLVIVLLLPRKLFSLLLPGDFFEYQFNYRSKTVSLTLYEASFTLYHITGFFFFIVFIIICGILLLPDLRFVAHHHHFKLSKITKFDFHF